MHCFFWIKFLGNFSIKNEQLLFTVSDVISDVLLLMKNNLNGIDLNINSNDKITLYGQRGELIQVIIIIISNAIEVLNLRNKNGKKQLYIDMGTLGKMVYITIEDNAGGIIPENLGTIFDPYFTTKKQSGGTGLGLYIAKIIVEQKMHGGLAVKNTSNGARFTITLNG